MKEKYANNFYEIKEDIAKDVLSKADELFEIFNEKFNVKEFKK